MQFGIDAESGWLHDVARVPSPNQDERPPGCAPSRPAAILRSMADVVPVDAIAI